MLTNNKIVLFAIEQMEETRIYELILAVSFIVLFVAAIFFIIYKSITTFKKKNVKSAEKVERPAIVIGKRTRTYRRVKQDYIDSLKRKEKETLIEDQNEVPTDSIDNNTSSDGTENKEGNDVVDQSQPVNSVYDDYRYEIVRVSYLVNFSIEDKKETKYQEYSVPKFIYDKLHLNDRGILQTRGIRLVGFVKDTDIKMQETKKEEDSEALYDEEK